MEKTSYTSINKKSKLLESSLCLFGGTFDPIHYGHLNVAKAILELGFIENLIFIPCFESPFKNRSKTLSYTDRVNMLKIAIKYEKRFKINLFEVKRKCISYSFETINYFKSNFNRKLYWVIGADQFNLLHKWNNISYILDEITFIVYPRKNFSIQAAPIMKEKTIKIYELDLPFSNISSSEIRELIKCKKSIYGLVPRDVADYINSNNLYI